MKLIIALCMCFALSAVHASFDDKVNGELITISGQVNEVKANTFRLNTGNKNILVEMDDYKNWVADGFKLMNGDNVVVTGRVDKDLFEKKKIEAGTVYGKNINTTFYANSADEEDLSYIPSTSSYFPSMPVGALVDLQGKITNISGREFTVDTGFRKVTVDTNSLIYNPLDDKGFTRLSVGDRVRVSGEVNEEFFDTTKEVSANALAELPAHI
jgi:uncharacterized protein YdeI (BOF family)